MAHTFRKLRLLIWKNFILQIRRPVGTVVEILLPVAFLALLIFARKLIDREEKCFTVQSPFDISQTENVISRYLSRLNITDLYENKVTTNDTKMKLTYYPITTHTTEVLQFVAEELNLELVSKNLKGNSFQSLDEIIEETKENYNQYIGAVIFNNYDDSSGFPAKVDYSLRFLHTMGGIYRGREDNLSWMTDWIYPFFLGIGPSTTNIYGVGNPFVHIQYAVDTGIIRKQTGSNYTAPKVAHPYPYPDYLRDDFISLVENIMPLVFILAFLYTAISVVKELVAEKQARLKESMKMMGLPNWIHWTAWFIKSLLYLLITCILCVILLKAGKIFEFTNAGIIFVFLLLYIIASIFTLFFVSLFFSNAVRSMLFGAVLWVASLAPYLSFSGAEDFDSLANSQKAASCLLPNTCLGIMIRIIAKREQSRVGVNWDNFNKGTSVAGDDFTLAQAFGVLIMDCILYGILLWYLENVMPGEFGISRPLYFPFQASYWCGSSKASRMSSVEDLRANSMKQMDNYEEEPKGVQIGVSIKNLRKVFNSAAGKKVAVDDLSLNIFKGQITALLGHNGAGKTTTMSILTGLFSQSGGTASINGKNTLTEMDGIRESLGLCPQHNVLFDRLSVEEHLEFFAALKGIPKSKAKQEIKEMIDDIQLSDKAKAKSATLSGGMKRKLNCAIALIGGSETVFLDEPTSGMDPYARRATWDLLQKYRANKTIILTTHFMDEADYLGDRIAIMADGKLKCCGSSLYLKKRYGVGYHMTLVKDSGFEENKTLGLISKMVPSSKMTGNVGAEVSYILESDSSTQFKPLFETLEEKKTEYGISSFGVSITTLEEVFLKVGEQTDNVDEDPHENGNDAANLHAADAVESAIPEGAMLTGFPLNISQFKAMFVKRFLHSRREKKAVVTQIILPLLLVICGLLLARVSNTQEDNPKRVMSLSMLKDRSDLLYGYTVDYRSSPTQQQKDLFSMMSKNYFDTISVTTEDKTDEVNKIKSNNTGSHIYYNHKSDSYNGMIGSDKKMCCNYPFLILNEQCRNAFTSIAEVKSICGDSPSKLGYRNCLSCMEKDALRCFGIPYIGELFENTMKSHPSFQELILQESSYDISTYFKDKVAALAMHDDGMKVWFANQAWHTLPSAYSAGSNTLVRVYMNSTDYGITTTNHPLPRNTLEQTQRATRNGDVLSLVMFISMASSFIAASFITFLVTEKMTKAKHIQFVSGVNSMVYWTATFCWDYINYLVPAMLIFIVIAAFDMDYFSEDLGAVFVSLLMFGLSILPFVYMISFLFQSAVIAYSVVAMIMLLLSLAMVIAVFIVRILKEDDIFDIMHHVFLIFPTYAFSQSLSDISTNYNQRNICTQSTDSRLECERSGTKFEDNVFSWAWPGIGKHLFFMFIEFIIYFAITILLEENFFVRFFIGQPTPNDFAAIQGEDVDVTNERKRVFEMSNDEMSNTAVVLKDLTKVYRTTGMTAVDHLNLAIPKGECFGLLGVNGAGKTTTFGMLTGELSISHGTAYMHGYNIQQNVREVQQRIGYCPQFDALVDNLTGREMLRMFARLRGIPAGYIEDVVTSVVKQLNLLNWADKMCGTYSGGNKRKLSTAMALVGNPPIVFLDEPTSGMDPGSRRFLWDTLTSLLNGGRSIVLTSHSMEECEALCTRLVIMVNGQFKCIGSIQHLKSRFGQGYTVMIKVQPRTERNAAHEHENPAYDDTESVSGRTFSRASLKSAFRGSINNRQSQSRASVLRHVPPASDDGTHVKEFMSEYFQGAYLIEERQGLFQYQILNNEIRWSYMFGTLEEHAEELGIVDYSISQTSLEQVFINFAKFQHSEERTFNKSCCSCVCF